MPEARNRAARFLRFLAVGGLSTAVQFMILSALVEWSVASPVHASALGYAGSASLNYVLNRRFTFRSSNTHHSAVPRFIIMCLAALVLNTALFAVLYRSGLHYVVCQVLTTVVVVVFNFAVASRWVFASVRVTARKQNDTCPTK